MTTRTNQTLYQVYLALLVTAVAAAQELALQADQVLRQMVAAEVGSITTMD
jgi:hypothetical protein